MDDALIRRLRREILCFGNAVDNLNSQVEGALSLLRELSQTDEPLGTTLVCDKRSWSQYLASCVLIEFNSEVSQILVNLPAVRPCHSLHVKDTLQGLYRDLRLEKQVIQLIEVLDAYGPNPFRKDWIKETDKEFQDMRALGEEILVLSTQRITTEARHG